MVGPGSVICRPFRQVGCNPFTEIPSQPGSCALRCERNDEGHFAGGRLSLDPLSVIRCLGRGRLYSSPCMHRQHELKPYALSKAGSSRFLAWATSPHMNEGMLLNRLLYLSTHLVWWKLSELEDINIMHILCRLAILNIVILQYVPRVARLTRYRELVLWRAGAA